MKNQINIERGKDDISEIDENIGDQSEYIL